MGQVVWVFSTQPTIDESCFVCYTPGAEEVVVVNVSRKFGTRRVFGTRRRSGCFFGQEVLALLMYEYSGKHPIDVYPQEKLGRTITIKEYLTGLLVNST